MKSIVRIAQFAKLMGNSFAQDVLTVKPPISHFWQQMTQKKSKYILRVI
jgi:hypothetical protein